jgi:hypothetical protein
MTIFHKQKLLLQKKFQELFCLQFKGGRNAMTKHLRNVLEGFAQALQVYPRRDYVLPDRNGFAHDQLALRGDAEKVVRHIRNNIDKAYEHANTGSRSKR